MATVSGDDTRTTAGVNRFNAILSNFAPTARQRGTSDDSVDIDLLIATDCISEGQNLQDCDAVLNYDIHWNPVRLIQRFGRIDRIGSRSSSVRMLNYWPTSDMDVYLKLENRVQTRMALADVAASGDEDPFTEADAQLELKFRDEQLLKLREQILVMDDLDDGPTMGDLTLDYFITQLLRYGAKPGRWKATGRVRRWRTCGRCPAWRDIFPASAQRRHKPTPTAGQPGSSLLFRIHPSQRRFGCSIRSVGVFERARLAVTSCDQSGKPTRPAEHGRRDKAKLLESLGADSAPAHAFPSPAQRRVSTPKMERDAPVPQAGNVVQPETDSRDAVI